ncbi:MAG: phage holin family protein [Anaerolineales bacterium]|nr:phage holin family protein [Anaerolineales bacterium]
MRLLLRWLIIVVSLVVAALVVPGIHVEGSEAWIAYSVMAIVLGLVNALIRPILKILSCGCIIATLGLFLLAINAFTLWLSSWIAVNLLGIGFYIESFWAAFLGALIVSMVSFLLSLVLIDDD